MDPRSMVIGWFAGVVMTITLVVLMASGQRHYETQTCMDKHKAPGCERVVEWVPLVRRGE